MNINICDECETVRDCMKNGCKPQVVEPVKSIYTDEQRFEAALWLHKLTSDQIVALYLKEVFT